MVLFRRYTHVMSASSAILLIFINMTLQTRYLPRCLLKYSLKSYSFRQIRWKAIRQQVKVNKQNENGDIEDFVVSENENSTCASRRALLSLAAACIINSFHQTNASLPFSRTLFCRKDEAVNKSATFLMCVERLKWMEKIEWDWNIWRTNKDTFQKRDIDYQANSWDQQTRNNIFKD